MIARQEFERKNFKTYGIIYNNELTSAKVTMVDMDERKHKKVLLQKMISDKVLLFSITMKSMIATYDYIEEVCQISISTLKKSMSGTTTITREFLYKFTLGMKMDIDEANEYFILCGGLLNSDNDCDYIAIKAINDVDNVYSLIDEFEKYLEKKIGLRERSYKAKSRG